MNIGLAADIGSLQRLPKLTGNDSLARELALTGRRFSAQEALSLGFLSATVRGGRDAVSKRAVEMAKEIASKSPVAVVGTKAVMNREPAFPTFIYTRAAVRAELGDYRCEESQYRGWAGVCGDMEWVSVRRVHCLGRG